MVVSWTFFFLGGGLGALSGPVKHSLFAQLIFQIWFKT